MVDWNKFFLSYFIFDSPYDSFPSVLIVLNLSNFAVTQCLIVFRSYGLQYFMTPFITAVYPCNIHFMFLNKSFVHGYRFSLRYDIPILLGYEYFVLFCPIYNQLPLVMPYDLSYCIYLWLFLLIGTIVILVILNTYLFFFPYFYLFEYSFLLFPFNHEEYVPIICSPHWNIW